ncbi:GNAT family N-acetyltransferase [Bacillus salitolerans]|uniref:GNAT family N-acetyltransferase n=1 Tax=Bacillus salitolerans TaxID=1437434 RepID=A0ABW4LQN4_9BACI
MKIKQLNRSNHREVLRLFGEEIVNYYFLLDGLVSSNYEKTFKVYGEYDEDRLVSILVNNFDRNITYYSNQDRDIGIYSSLLRELNYSKLSGPKVLMEKFIPFIKVKENTMSYLGVVKNIVIERKLPISIKVAKTKEEIGMQYELLSSTTEFSSSLPKTKSIYIANEYKRLQESSDRTVYLEINNDMVSSCATIIEDKNSAIIIGVVSNPSYRNKGYGTEVLIGLFELLLEEGKLPYLFYNNPSARSVYKKIG